MPPRVFQRTQIPNEMATPRGRKPTPAEKLGFLVITHVVFYKMPSWPEQQAENSSHTQKQKATKWCMTCDGAREDLKVVRRGWNDGGKIPSAEIRLMYYDIPVPDATFAENLFGNVRDVGQGREFNQEQREKGKEKGPLCEDLCVMYKDRLCCEA